MKQRACLTILLMTIAASVFAQQTTDHRSPVVVPDETTAVKIAEKALTKIYGKGQIQSERPFTAKLTEGIWHVRGTLYCKDQRGKVIANACVGGVAMADIRQSDGRVLRTVHTQ